MTQLEKDRRLMEKLCAIEEGLTPWEITFVDDVTKAVERGKVLEPGQRDKAYQILAERG